VDDPTVKAEDDKLVGGMNTVRRVGPHVIRPLGPHSASVHQLLRYVRAKGFMEGPEVVDVDVFSGTETLTYLEGETTNYPLADAFRTDGALTSAAQLLRRFHDATEGFESRPGDHWFLPPQHPVEVMCHGDFAPYNCVMNHGSVTGAFDFDIAHPGPRLWDVGYAAYRWALLTAPTNSDEAGSPAEQRRRLRLFCDAYGTDDTLGVVVAAQMRLGLLVETIRSLASAGHAAFGQHIADSHDQLYLSDIAYLRDQAAFFAHRG
jgi:aminoglycoside phosphotransferase (APT) family kinase protein